MQSGLRWGGWCCPGATGPHDRPLGPARACLWRLCGQQVLTRYAAICQVVIRRDRAVPPLILLVLVLALSAWGNTAAQTPRLLLLVGGPRGIAAGPVITGGGLTWLSVMLPSLWFVSAVSGALGRHVPLLMATGSRRGAWWLTCTTVVVTAAVMSAAATVGIGWAVAGVTGGLGATGFQVAWVSAFWALGLTAFGMGSTCLITGTGYTLAGFVFGLVLVWTGLARVGASLSPGIQWMYWAHHGTGHPVSSGTSVAILAGMIVVFAAVSWVEWHIKDV